MNSRRVIEEATEHGEATVLKDGQEVARGYLRARIVREVIVWDDGERAAGIPDYQAVLEDLVPPLYDLEDVVVHACGRTIPCNVDGGAVYPSASISPAL